jgi:predicted N-acetyltransferase YhbS
MHIEPAGAGDRAAIETLLDDAFGRDRHGRTAYRLRVGCEPLDDLSLVARDGERLIGSVQYWDIALDDGHRRHALTLLGPVAVAPDRQQEGIGKALVARSLAAADARGHDAILLIGDPEYYSRFGFSQLPTAFWIVPGPVERRRLLARLGPRVALPRAGVLGPAAAPIPLAA